MNNFTEPQCHMTNSYGAHKAVIPCGGESVTSFTNRHTQTVIEIQIQVSSGDITNTK